MKQSRQQNVRGIIHYMRIQGAISSKTRTTFRLASTADSLYSFCSFSQIIELGATGIPVSRRRVSQSVHVGTHVHTHLHIDNVYVNIQILYSVKKEKRQGTILFYTIDV